MQNSGCGAVYSYTIVYRPPDASFKTTFCAAIIAIDEGWFMLGNIVATSLQDIKIAMPVRVRFVKVGAPVLPMFVASFEAEHSLR